MTRRMLAVAILGIAVGATLPQDAVAFGKKRGDCDQPCATPAPCGPQYTVSYEEKKVTAYKQEMKTKDVKVMVNEWQDVKETFKHMVAEPVVTKQKVMVCETKTKEETYKYMAMEWATVKEKVKVCDHKKVEKEIDVVTCEMVPTQTMVKKTVCETVCVPVTVTKVVCPKPERKGLFAKCCKKGCDDPCAPPPCPQTVTCTVMQKQTVSKVIEVPCTTWTRVEKKSKQKVTVLEPVWSEKEVEVKKCVPVEKVGKRMVCYTEQVAKEIDVRSCKYVEKTDTRMVKKCVPVEKVVKQSYCVTVPYETTVKVPVYKPVPVPPAPTPAPCASPCETPCAATPCSGGRTRGRLLGGCCGR